jgi:hypothetical protein
VKLLQIACPTLLILLFCLPFQCTCPGGGSPPQALSACWQTSDGGVCAPDSLALSYQLTSVAVTVTNVSSSALHVTAVKIVGDSRSAFSLSGVPSLPLALQASGAFNLTVSYRPPVGVGTDGALLAIDTDSQPELDIPVTGVAGPFPDAAECSCEDGGECIFGSDAGSPCDGGPLGICNLPEDGGADAGTADSGTADAGPDSGAVDAGDAGR